MVHEIAWRIVCPLECPTNLYYIELNNIVVTVNENTYSCFLLNFLHRESRTRDKEKS